MPLRMKMIDSRAAKFLWTRLGLPWYSNCSDGLVMSLTRICWCGVRECSHTDERLLWEVIQRMDDLVSTEATDPVKKQVLDSLGNKFVTAEAVKAGADFGLQDVLSCICSKTSVRKLYHQRQARQLWESTEVEPPPCTVCTLHFLHSCTKKLHLCQTSAKVQKVQGATSAEPYEWV